VNNWRLAPCGLQILFLMLICTTLLAAQQTDAITVNIGDTPTLVDARKPTGPHPERPLVKEGDPATLPPYLKDAETNILPQAPWPPEPDKPGFWTFRNSQDGPALRTNGQVFHDKTWRATQIFWLGSIVYDVELTHQGLAHHKCVENSIENPHPSRGDLYSGHIAEYAVGTGLNWLFMKYVSKSLILEFPGYASVKHLQGGSEWLVNCW
jgi:hypothetical protein